MSNVDMTLLRANGDQEYPALAERLGSQGFQELLNLIERIVEKNQTDLVSQIEREARRG